MRRYALPIFTALALTVAPTTAVASWSPTAEGAATSVAPAAAEVDDILPVERVAGSDRYATAALAARQWKPGVERVYVVSGQDYPDAMTAAARAGVGEAPVLLTKPGTLPAETTDALADLRPARIVVIGGTRSVSRDVLDQLGRYSGDGDATRIGGANRYVTAANLAKRYPAGGTRVYLASGEGFPDSLAATAIAGVQDAPLLLTRPGRLPDATVRQLRRLSADQVVVVGGQSSVTKAVAERAASDTTSGTYQRLAGGDRYQTAAAVAQAFPAPTNPGLIASGQAFPDALIAGALGATRGAPVVLTPRSSASDGTWRAMNHLDPERLLVMGGKRTISATTVNELSGRSSGPSTVSTGAYNGMGSGDDQAFVDLVGGVKLTHATSYYTSGNVNRRWPKPRDRQRLQNGTTLLMGMASKNWNRGGPNSHMAWDEIAAGQHDAEIRGWGRKLAQAGGKVWFAFDIEPDVKLHQGKVPRDWTGSEYAAAARRISTLVRGEADNVEFLFWVGGHQKGLVQAMYPGDEFVDRICWDPYINSRRSPDTTPLALWSEFKGWLDTRDWGQGKPIGLCETGFHNGFADAKGAEFWQQAPAAADELGLSFITYFHRNSGSLGNYSLEDMPRTAEALGEAMREMQQ